MRRSKPSPHASPEFRYGARWEEAASPCPCHLGDRRANNASELARSRQRSNRSGLSGNRRWTRLARLGNVGAPTHSRTSPALGSPGPLPACLTRHGRRIRACHPWRVSLRVSLLFPIEEILGGVRHSRLLAGDGAGV